MNLNEIVNIVTAFAVIVFGTVLQRSFTKRDKARKKAEADKEQAEAAKEARLVRMERTLNKHTRSLSALTHAHKLTNDTVAQHSEDLEELEEATLSLNAQTRENASRIKRSEGLIERLREERLRNDATRPGT